MQKISNEAVNVLRQNARSVVRELGLLNDAYFDIGVTLAERHFLIELNSSLYPTVGEIAERLMLDKSTASRLISKAVKKGYVNCLSDETDKRKRFLQLTEKGKKVLHEFEPIAFNQTKDALLTLTPEEIETVYRGIALYAKGLKNSRLQKKIAVEEISSQDNAPLALMLADIYKGGNKGEWSNLFEIYSQKGCTYLVMKMDSKIIGGAGISPWHETSFCELEKLWIQTEYRNLGLEKILIDLCLKRAKRLGYKHCCVDTGKEAQFSSEFFQDQGFHMIKNNKQKASLLCKAC